MKRSALLLVALLALSGCATPEVERPRPLKSLKCIAVLPVKVAPDAAGEGALQAQTLAKGARYASDQMVGLLATVPQARIISSDRVDSLPAEVVGGNAGLIAAIGEETGCDGVLYTTLERFRQREGGDYSVDAPASAAFSMALFYAPTAEVLWTADFRETQQPFLANVFSSRMGKTGFRWITVEELLKQGLQERLASSRYLSGGQ